MQLDGHADKTKPSSCTQLDGHADKTKPSSSHHQVFQYSIFYSQFTIHLPKSKLFQYETNKTNSPKENSKERAG